MVRMDWELDLSPTGLSNLPIFSRLPISVGIVPANWLSANHKFCIFVHSPISAGIVPSKLFRLDRQFTMFFSPLGPPT